MVMRQAVKWPHKFIDTEDALKAAIKLLKNGSINTHGVAVDIEAFCISHHAKHLGEISLLQLAGPADPHVYIFDVVTLGADRTAHYVKRVLCHPHIKKYMFDCRKDVEAVSIQMGLQFANVLDLQLYHTATEWLAKGGNRRSHIDFVLQSLAGIKPSEELKAVKAAFNVGRRKVWDERPLPDHLVSYAANDVRHMLVLADHFAEKFPHLEKKVEELTQHYIGHFSTGFQVTKEVDPKSNMVSPGLLRKYVGDAAKCSLCGKQGHTAEKCFDNDKSSIRCQHCGSQGHLSNNCFKLHPERNKCSFCGHTGHLASRCFLSNPCEKCGGKHPTDKCLGKPPSEEMNKPKAVKPEITCMIGKSKRQEEIEQRREEAAKRYAERQQGAEGPDSRGRGAARGSGFGRGAPAGGWGGRGAAPGWGAQSSGWGGDQPGRGGWGGGQTQQRGGWGGSQPAEGSGWGAGQAPQRGGWGGNPPAGGSGWSGSQTQQRGGWGGGHGSHRGGWGSGQPPAQGAGWGSQSSGSAWTGRGGGGWGAPAAPASPGQGFHDGIQ